MSDCRVICSTCRTDTDRPKIWHWLCEECATECADQHRKETGHLVELRITREITAAELVERTCHAAKLLRRRSWRQ